MTVEVVSMPVSANPSETPMPITEAPVAPASEPVTNEAAPAEPVSEPASPSTPEAATAATETPNPAEPSASILSEATKPLDAKPADAPKEPAEGETPASEEPPAPAEPAPIVYDLKVPDGYEMPTDQMSRVTEAFGKHNIAPEAAQELFDQYAGEIQRLQQDTLKNQYAEFEQMRTAWRDEFKADTEIGGNRRDTTLLNASRVIQEYGGTPAQQAELRNYLTVTGMGDHPSLIRLLHNVGKVLGEPRPVAAAKPVPEKQTKAQRRYATNSGV